MKATTTLHYITQSRKEVDGGEFWGTTTATEEATEEKNAGVTHLGWHYWVTYLVTFLSDTLGDFLEWHNWVTFLSDKIGWHSWVTHMVTFLSDMLGWHSWVTCLVDVLKWRTWVISFSDTLGDSLEWHASSHDTLPSSHGQEKNPRGEKERKRRRDTREFVGGEGEQKEKNKSSRFSSSLSDVRLTPSTNDGHLLSL